MVQTPTYLFNDRTQDADETFALYTKLAAMNLVSNEVLDKLAISAEEANARNTKWRRRHGAVGFNFKQGPHISYRKASSPVGSRLGPTSNPGVLLKAKSWRSYLPKSLNKSVSASLSPELRSRLADAMDTTKSEVLRNYQWKKVKSALGLTGEYDINNLQNLLSDSNSALNAEISNSLKTKATTQASNQTLKAMAEPAVDPRTGKVLKTPGKHFWNKKTIVNQFDRSTAEDFMRNERLAAKGETQGFSAEALNNNVTTEQQMQQIGKKRSKYTGYKPEKPVKPTKSEVDTVKKSIKKVAPEGGFVNFLKTHKRGLGIAGTAATALTIGGLLLHSHNEDQRRKEEERRRNNALMTGAIGSLAGAGLGYSMGGGTGALIGGLAGGGLGGAAGYKFSSYGDLQAVSDKLSVHLLDWHSMKAAGRKIQGTLGKDEGYEDFEKEENTLPEHRQFFNTKHSNFTLIPSRKWTPGLDLDASVAIPAAVALAGGIGGYALASRLVPDSWKAQALSAALGAGVGGLAGYELSGGKMPWQ